VKQLYMTLRGGRKCKKGNWGKKSFSWFIGKENVKIGEGKIENLTKETGENRRKERFTASPVTPESW